MIKAGMTVFAIFFIIFLVGQASIRGFWSYDDPYYHARHSALINETGNLTLVEPWLTRHFFNYAPTDPWWGYHVAMAGFIHFLGPVWGSKVFSAGLAALIFAVFYSILRSNQAKRPWLWTALFWASSAPLLSRLLLERPHLLAPSALLLAWWFSVSKKYLALFILFLIYTLIYHQAPLLLTVPMVVMAVECVLRRQLDLKLLIAGTGGILGGIILHPQSLNYVYVMWVGLWQIFYLRFTGIDLGIGNELVTMAFSAWLRSSLVPLIFYLTAWALLFALKDKWPGMRRTSALYSLAAISGAWFLVALAVPRGGEYWLPFAWLFCVLTFHAVRQTDAGQEIKHSLQRTVWTKVTRPFVYTGVIGLIAINVFIVGGSIKEQNADLFPEQVKAAAEWLKDNTPSGSVVFYDNWSYWPLMFYYNQHNRYLNGMDPTFMYEYDPKLFWLWRNISQNGYVCDQEDGCLEASPRAQVRVVADVIRNQFQSNYILIYNEPQSPIYRTLSILKSDFQKVFGNEKFLVYQVLPPTPQTPSHPPP